MSLWKRLFGKAGAGGKVKPEEVPTIRSIIDTVAERTGHIRGYSGSSYHSQIKETILQRDPIDLGQLLKPEELALAEKVGLGRDLLTHAAHAFCFQSFNVRVGADTFCDEVFTTWGDQAIEKLCTINSLLSSYVLHRVTGIEPITITLSACIGSTEYTFDFAKRAERARKELERRGFGDRDPLDIVVPGKSGEDNS